MDEMRQTYVDRMYETVANADDYTDMTYETVASTDVFTAIRYYEETSVLGQSMNHIWCGS